MQQTIQHRVITTEGTWNEDKKRFDLKQEDQVVLHIKDIKYDMSLTKVEMTLDDAMELHRLLGNKLGEIPA